MTLVLEAAVAAGIYKWGCDQLITREKESAVLQLQTAFRGLAAKKRVARRLDDLTLKPVVCNAPWPGAKWVWCIEGTGIYEECMLCHQACLLYTVVGLCGTANDIARCAQVSKQWRGYLTHCSSYPASAEAKTKTKNIRRLWKFCVRSTGIPRRGKAGCWCYLAGVVGSRSRNQRYADLVQRGRNSPYHDAIMLDVHRAYGSPAMHKRRSLSRKDYLHCFATPAEVVQIRRMRKQQLYRLLLAMAAKHPEVGYCQVRSRERRLIQEAVLQAPS
jgi:hypothetical protein